MIEQPGKFPDCHLHRGIRIFRDSEIFFQIFHFYSDIFPGVLPEHFRHRCVFRTCIGDTQFPVCVGLRLQRFNHFPQEFFRRFICRDNHTDQRLFFPLFLSLCFQFFFRWFMAFKPWSVRHFFRFHPLAQAHPELLRSVMFQITKPLFDRIRFYLFQITHPVS